MRHVYHHLYNEIACAVKFKYKKYNNVSEGIF